MEAANPRRLSARVPVEGRMKIVTKDPAALQMHALQKPIPRPDKTGPQWSAFVASVREAGVLSPLLINERDEVMDGGWRREAALELRLPGVPCVVRPDAEAALIVVETLIHRKQMSRGAAVYLLLPQFRDFMAATETRRLANLKRGGKIAQNPNKSPNPSVLGFGDVPTLCARLGIGTDTYERARHVRELFDRNSEIKARLEPQLLSGEKNLWNILSAAAGAAAPQTDRDFKAVQTSFRSLKGVAASWNKLNPADQKRLIDPWLTTASALPSSLRQFLIEGLRFVEKKQANGG